MGSPAGCRAVSDGFVSGALLELLSFGARSTHFEVGHRYLLSCVVSGERIALKDKTFVLPFHDWISISCVIPSCGNEVERLELHGYTQCSNTNTISGACAHANIGTRTGCCLGFTKSSCRSVCILWTSYIDVRLCSWLTSQSRLAALPSEHTM